MSNTKYEIPEEYKNECYERMVIARTAMVMTCPFFGVLVAQLKPVENNTWCQTLAVDGKHLYYNVEFIMGVKDPARKKERADKLRKVIPDITDEQINATFAGLSNDNLIAALCHEVLHCAYNHFLRKGSRNMKLWNKAADYAINQIIKRSKVGEIQDTWLYDARFENMTAEEIYNILLDEKGSGDTDKSSGGTLDQHQTSSGDTDNSDDDDGEHEYDDDDRPCYTQEELSEFMEAFKDAMISASMYDGAPPEIRAMVNDYKEPKIDWRSKINRTLRSLIKNDVSYMTLSRRSWVNGIGYGMPVYPGLKPDLDIDICVALDASGSITAKMLQDFLSEVYGITQQYSQFKIRILTFDTDVYEVRDYVNGQEQQILEYPIRGGGGTLFTAVWEHMKNDDYRPNQLIMFTDGEPFGSWGDPDYCDTLFIVHSNPKKESPFGVTVHYTE